MPFQSKAQQRWAFANNEPFAKKWADKTNFKRLPVRKKTKEEDVEEAASETSLAALTRNFSPTKRRVKVRRP